MLSGIGYYAELAVPEDVEGQNEDVQSAVEDLGGVTYDEDRSSSILQGPLAVVVPFVDGLMVIKMVLGNTSGLLQLLFGVPAAVADPIETLFQLAIGVTILFGLRGAVQ